MPGSKNRKKTNGHSAPADDTAEGLWIDTALILRLHGRRSSPLATNLTVNAESHRLLHYADVILGNEKKEEFFATKPKKERTK